MLTPQFDSGCAEYSRAYAGALDRRRLLAGTLGIGGLSLADVLRSEAAGSPKRGMSCILLWLRGGPSSIDMWDLKPDAPSEVRGEFRPIPTNISGIRISEHLPRLATMADRYCLVRSVTHGRDDHEGGSHYNSSGWNTWPAVPYPMFGTVVQKRLGYAGIMPPHVHLPEPPQPYTGGRHYLPHQDLPFPINCMNDLDLHVRDVGRARDLDVARLERRRRLLGSEGPAAGAPEPSAPSDVFYRRAFEILSSQATGAAFDLTREPAKLRDRYGRGRLAADVVAQGNAGDVAPNDFNRSIVGQGLLMARRLVEAGVRFVTVVGRGWDTHADNFNRLRDQLLPPVDQGVSALLADLADRGLLDTTLVIVTGDFNRTPKINRDAGRDHWGKVQTLFLAGGGVPGGCVIGESDESCAYPKERPILPEEIAATIFHKFGISPADELTSLDGRPFRVLPDGVAPVRELI